MRRFFRRRRVEDELDEELNHFFDAAVERQMAAGLSRDEAVRAVRVETGSVAAIKDRVRDVAINARLESVWRDVRHAARLLRFSPGFSAAAIVPLALGIGAAVTVYSTAYGILLRPLPVQDERTVAIGYHHRGVATDGPLSYPRYLVWRDSGAFADLAAMTGTRLDLTEDGLTEQVRGAGVTRNFFSLLGVRPAHGRLLNTADAETRAPVAVISHGLWKRRFGGDPLAVGRTIEAGRRKVTIVGVAAERFEYWRGDTQLWFPVEFVNEPRILSSVGYIIVTPVARLRHDRTIQQTEAQLAAVDAGYTEEKQDRKRNATTVALVALRDDVVPATLKRTLVVLLASVALTALVVCVHVSNMVLARGMRRSSEIAVRLAIGAHRRRIVRQLAIESLVLAVPGGVAGWLVAYWGVNLLEAFGPPGIGGNEAIRIDLPVTFFAVGLTLATALSSALGPALRLSRTSLQTMHVDRIAPRKLSGTLLTLQIALAVMVLVGASLLVKSFARLTRVDMGFQTQNLLTVLYDLSGTIREIGTAAERRQSLAHTQRELLASLRGIPGVEAVSFGPVFRPSSPARISVRLDDGREYLNGNPAHGELAPRGFRASAGYFRMHGVAVTRGREFSERDDENSPGVAVVNETMARMLWSGQNPVGRRVNFEGLSFVKGKWEHTAPWFEIVGVVADMRFGSADSPILPEIYRNIAQEPGSGGYVIVKTTVEPSNVISAVRDAFQIVDQRIPVYAPHTVQNLVDEANAITRYNAALLSLCAGIATLLGGFGVYSLLAYSVAARRRELGIRIALGAEPRRLVSEVVKQAGWLMVIGIGCGLLLAAFATGILSSLLFEVSPRDPLVFAGAGGLVAVIALAAAWLPARSASRLDPVRALKID